MLITAGAAALAAYHLQGTGWYYQQLPALSLFCAAFGLVLLERFSRRTGRRVPGWLVPAIAALAVLAVGLTAAFSDFHLVGGRLEQPQPDPDPGFFAGLAPGAAVATLTTSVDDTVPPAFRYHLTLAQRYPHLWATASDSAQPVRGRSCRDGIGWIRCGWRSWTVSSTG